MKRMCSVPGCPKPSRIHGMCVMHDKRTTRNGDPNVTRMRPPGTFKAKLVELIASADPDACSPWPYHLAYNGYPTLTINNRTRGGHVVACEITHGPRPSPRHQVAHSCGNRSCVNPHHLRWATPAENAADRVLHGTVLTGEKHWTWIGPEREAEIVAYARTAPSVADVCRHFGMWHPTVLKLLKRHGWSQKKPGGRWECRIVDVS